MKISFVSRSEVPSDSAESVFVMKMCDALTKKDHEVCLTCPRKRNKKKFSKKQTIKNYGLEGGFEIKRFRMSSIYGSSLIYSLRASYHAFRNKCDIVYSRLPIAGYVSSALRIPVVLEIHQPIYRSKKIHEISISHLLNKSQLKKIVLITENLKKDFVSFFDVDESIINVIPDAADRPNNQIRKKKIVKSSSQMDVGYVGHLYEGKGVNLISKIASIMDGVKFHIVGGTEEDIRYWKNKVSNENILFHGFVPKKEVGSFISSFDICLLPNQPYVSTGSENEADIGKFTSPMKMFEYMSHEKPIVASKLDVIEEVLSDRVNSILCDPRDPRDWKSAILELKDNVELRNKIAHNAYKKLVNKYTWNNRVEEVLKGVL